MGNILKSIGYSSLHDVDFPDSFRNRFNRNLYRTSKALLGLKPNGMEGFSFRQTVSSHPQNFATAAVTKTKTWHYMTERGAALNAVKRTTET